MYEIKIRLPKQIALTISFEYIAIGKRILRQAFQPISVSLLPRNALALNLISQLSLRTHCICGRFSCGDPPEIRTPDPLIKSWMPYELVCILLYRSILFIPFCKAALQAIIKKNDEFISFPKNPKKLKSVRKVLETTALLKAYCLSVCLLYFIF